jgi:acyl dehydratase
VSKIYLENLKVGDEFRSDEFPVTEAAIHAFAAEFDPQPFHLDADAARDSVFNGLAASGWHTAAITMKLLADSVPLASGLIGVDVQISWPKPTRPGDVLHVVSRVIDITPSRSKPDRGIVTVQSETLNHNGDVCQKLVSKLLVFRNSTAGNS